MWPTALVSDTDLTRRNRLLASQMQSPLHTCLSPDVFSNLIPVLSAMQTMRPWTAQGPAF